ncbi:MAG: DUF2905 domain-containing protein [Candidatus Woesearchaeota archaeon]
MLKPETILIGLGTVAILAGILMRLGVPLGNFPGDIRIVNENARVYIPITTMLLVSALLTLVFYLLRLATKS